MTLGDLFGKTPCLLTDICIHICTESQCEIYFLLWVVAQSLKTTDLLSNWGQKYYKTVWVPELQAGNIRGHNPLSTESSVAGRCLCRMSAGLLGNCGTAGHRAAHRAEADSRAGPHRAGVFPSGLRAQLFQVLHWKPRRHRAWKRGSAFWAACYL